MVNLHWYCMVLLCFFPLPKCRRSYYHFLTYPGCMNHGMLVVVVVYQTHPPPHRRCFWHVRDLHLVLSFCVAITCSFSWFSKPFHFFLVWTVDKILQNLTFFKRQMKESTSNVNDRTMRHVFNNWSNLHRYFVIKH